MKLFLGLLVGLLLVLPSWAQPVAQTDSLRRQLALSALDTNRVLLLLALGRQYVLRPGEQAADLDSALVLAGQARRLSTALAYARGQGLGYVVSGQAEREKGNRAQGLRLAQQAVALLTKPGTAEDRADALAELASYYSLEAGDLAKKIQLYEQLVPLLEQSNARKKLADALKYRGDLYQVQNKYHQSLRDLRQALTVYQSIGFTRIQDLYELLGNVSMESGDLEQALHYGLLGLKTAEQFRDSSMLVTSYNRVGLTYSRLEMYPDAERYFHRALSSAQQHRDTTAVLTISMNLVTIYKATRRDKQALNTLNQLVRRYSSTPLLQFANVWGNLLRLHTRSGQYGAAQQACDKLLQLATRTGPDDPMQPYVQFSVIPFFLATRQYARVRQQLLLNRAYAERNGLKTTLADNHLMWFKLDSLQGDYPSAIQHYQQYQAIKASLLTETRSQQIKELDVEYKTYEKQHSIQLLTQKSALQQAQLATARATRNLGIASAGLLLLVLGLGYNRYRLKQRSAQLLEAQQVEIHTKNGFLQQVLQEKEHLLTEKEWMLREIHHRVKNNLQIISSLLHSQSAYLKDETALAAIRESQNRVHAMALIHQKLYQSERLSVVPMADYIPEIVNYLLQTYDREETVATQLDVEPLELDIAMTVPLGLILNEAITNALKYGLPAGRRGTLRVALRTQGAHTYLLVVGDDGVGLPSNFDPYQSRTQGMSLIRGLSKQIRGQLRITQEQGVQLSLQFYAPPVPSNAAAANDTALPALSPQ